MTPNAAAGNAYDDLRPNVADLIATQDTYPDLTARTCGFARSVLRRSCDGVLIALGVHRRLVYASLRLTWFHEFAAYWTGELGGRPLSPSDFHYLAGVYRGRAQTLIDLEDATNDDAHLATWRDPRLVSALFAHTYREACSPLRVHRFARYVPWRGRIAEFGCGIAPLIAGLVRYYGGRRLQLVGVDIPHVLFHFARWRLRGVPGVSWVSIRPRDDAPLPALGTYDTIFCTEVFEHLPRPLATVAHLHKALRPGGHLVYDYIASEGRGLDTKAAVRDRTEVLQFITDRFAIVERRGGTCVGRKR